MTTGLGSSTASATGCHVAASAMMPGTTTRGMPVPGRARWLSVVPARLYSTVPVSGGVNVIVAQVQS
ncbi:hypothetical protein LT337_00500 [Mycolicibacterium fortuitum]|nr:hypothetical protein LT337_00500 [Mycolicibacterium fortuitum]